MQSALSQEIAHSLRLTSGPLAAQDLAGAEVRFGDVGDVAELKRVAFSEPVDVVVSCLASRTGGKVRGKGGAAHLVAGDMSPVGMWDACGLVCVSGTGCKPRAHGQLHGHG